MGKYGITARVIGPDGAGEIVDKRKGERLVRYDDVDLPVTWVAKSDLSIETWVPKVGDRVRMHETSTWYNDCTMTVGTVVSLHDDGARFYARFDGDDFDWCLDVEDVYLTDLPVAAEAQPAPAGLQIEAGRYYKTRDGRKVGPIILRGGSDHTYPFKAEVDILEPDRVTVAIWKVDGTNYEYRWLDLVAEWIDEPIVAVDEVAVAEATATPVKVGDRVKIKDPDDTDEGIVVSRNSDGHMSIKWDQFDCAGPEWWSDHELELVTTQPANDNLVVTITAKNESVADALRTIAAALNAA